MAVLHSSKVFLKYVTVTSSVVVSDFVQICKAYFVHEIQRFPRIEEKSCRGRYSTETFPFGDVYHITAIHFDTGLYH